MFEERWSEALTSTLQGDFNVCGEDFGRAPWLYDQFHARLQVDIFRLV